MRHHRRTCDRLCRRVFTKPGWARECRPHWPSTFNKTSSSCPKRQGITIDSPLKASGACSERLYIRPMGDTTLRESVYYGIRDFSSSTAYLVHSFRMKRGVFASSGTTYMSMANISSFPFHVANWCLTKSSPLLSLLQISAHTCGY
jgi:hypothetical protein